MTAPVFAVVNYTAGTGRGEALWSVIAERLRALDLDYRFELTQGPMTAASFTRQALRSGAQTVLAVGGDGTVNEALNGFFLDDAPINPDACLAIVPVGTSSDAARGLGIPEGVKSVDLLLAGQARPIDVGRAALVENGRSVVRYFLNNADVGIGARIAAGADRFKRLGGRLAFLLSSVQALSRPQAWGGRLRTDQSEPESIRAVSAVVALGPFTGGGMKIAPGAKWDDGLFDVVLIGEMAAAELLLHFPRIYAGTHLSHPKVRHIRSREVAVATEDHPPIQVDGEVAGRGAVEFRILPGAVRVYLPRP